MLIIIVSCEENIEVDLLENQYNRLIVEGGITNEPGKAHTIKLTRSVNYYDTSDVPVVTNAKVTISDGINEYLLNETVPGNYQTDPDLFTGVIGKTYTLNITLESGESYMASETIEPVASIDSITYIYENNIFEPEVYYYKIMYFGPEPKGYGNFYQWNMYINEELYNDTLRETAMESDLFVDGQYIFDFDIYWLKEEELPQEVNEIKFEILSISEKFFQFRNEILQQTVWRGGLFDTPPTNISSSNILPVNHNNEAFGYFKVSAVDSYTFILDKNIKKERKPFKLPVN